MKRIIFLYRHLLLNRAIKKLYNTHVRDNDPVKNDIIQTFTIRNCKKEAATVFDKFKHLMKYYPSFVFVFFWRIKGASSYYKKLFKVPNYNCKIFGSTKIGGGLNCFHPFATVINAKTIGENFEFRNGLTIGNKNNDNSLIPTIGNNVIVGANVCIIGNITVGDNVVIGAGAIVVKDIPSNSVAAGNPARVIKQN